MANLRIFVYLAAAALLAGGCKTVGPDYAPPEIDTPAAYTPRPGVAQAPEIALQTWWRSFNDATLDSLIERARQNNLDLAQAQARVRQARAQLGIAMAGFRPAVGAAAVQTTSEQSLTGVEAARSNAGGLAGLLMPESDRDMELYQAGFDATWEIDLFGRVQRQAEAAEREAEAAEAGLYDVLVSLTAETAANYVALRDAQRQAELVTRLAENQRAAVELARLRHESGLAPGIEATNAEAALSQIEADLPRLFHTQEAIIQGLALLTASDPAALREELAPDSSDVSDVSDASDLSGIPDVPDALAVDIPADLLRRRPDLRRAERRLAAAVARIGVAEADLYPRLTLKGALGWSTTDLGHLVLDASRFASIGSSFTLPVYTGGAVEKNIEAARARADEALAAYQQAVRRAVQDVETALSAWSREHERCAALEEKRVAARTNLDRADLSLELGLVSRTERLAAEQTALRAEADLDSARAALARDVVAVYKALGGGWE